MYLCRVKGYWYFRIRIPQDLRGVFPSGELKKSLKTSSWKNAKALVKVYCYRAERLFTLMRCAVLTGEHIKALVNKYLHDTLEADEDFRILHDSPMEDSLNEKLQKAYQAVIAERKAELAANDLKAIEPHADSLLKEAGLELKKDSVEYKRLCRELLKAEIDYFTVGLERYKGNYHNWFDGTLKQAALAAPMVSPEAHHPAKPLLEALKEYIKEKTSTGAWREKVAKENAASYKRFLNTIRLLKDIQEVQLKDITRDELIQYSETLRILPPNINKRQELIGKSLAEVIEITKSKGLKPMSPRTRNKNLQQVDSFFRWCIDERRYLDYNPAKNLKVKQEGKAYEQREDYSREDLERLLSSPVYSGETENPEQFWIPLIALFSGMRLEEICQLYLSDIQRVGCFTFLCKIPSYFIISDAITQ